MAKILAIEEAKQRDRLIGRRQYVVFSLFGIYSVILSVFSGKICVKFVILNGKNITVIFLNVGDVK
jgi:hypothetical protein